MPEEHLFDFQRRVNPPPPTSMELALLEAEMEKRPYCFLGAYLRLIRKELSWQTKS